MVTSPDAVNSFYRRYQSVLCCPRCHAALEVRDGDRFVCTACAQQYPSGDGVPSLFTPNEWSPTKDDVTEDIKAFYEKTPFPNYDDFDSAASLIEKARRSVFAKALDDQLPFGARVLECGCGTGQLSAFLSIKNRRVIGTDLCLNSLKMATEFKQRNNLDGVNFLQMNLFRPAFKPGSFDLVISNGVLHHTSDPFLGFKSIATLVRPGGHILVGLYHKYGRIATNVRRWIFSKADSQLRFLDRHAVDSNVSRQKRHAWFMDQYRNPHESTHTVGEVLGWLKAAKLEFVSAIPKTVPFAEFTEEDELFRQSPLGNSFERLLVNLGMVMKGHREGGFFIVIARRPRDTQ